MSNPTGVAVDNSPSSSSGDVYVANGPKVSKFTAEGKELGTIETANLAACHGSEGFSSIFGVAVDSANGDLYVADAGAGTVSAFDPTGTCIYQITVGGSPHGVTIDPSHGAGGMLYVSNDGSQSIESFDAATGAKVGGFDGQFGGALTISANASGDIYVATYYGEVLEYGPNGECLNSCAPIDTNAPSAVAVDPTDGHVLVEEGAYTVNARTAEFAPPEATPLTTFGQGTMSGPFNQGESYGVAVNAETGRVYVASYYDSVIDVFSRLLTLPSISGLSVAGLTQTSASVNATVSPDSAHGGGEVTGCRLEYVTSKEFGETHFATLLSGGSITCNPTPPYSTQREVSTDLAGLTPSTTYHYRFAVTNADGTNLGEYGEDNTFETLPAVAELKAQPATNITPTSATFNGSFIGNGDDTHYYFEWGTEQGSLKHRAPDPPADAGSPAGPGASQVSVNLTELLPTTTYYYRAVAANSVGVTSSINEESFVTPTAEPAISNESVTDVHSESALLHARLNPGGAETTYQFEYGTNASYGTDTPVPEARTGSGRADESVEAQVGGLEPGMTYHYRLVATNSAGTTVGDDRTFNTFPSFSELKEQCPNSLSRQQTGASQLLDCRSYEIVSAANAGGYSVETTLASEGEETPFGGYPEAENPPRVLYSVDHGAIPGTDHPTNKGSDPYVATRGENGWSTEYVGVPASNPFSAEPFSSVPSGANSSLQSFAFGSPGGCSPCFAGGYTGTPVHLPDGELVQGMAGSLDPGPSAKPAGQIGKDLSADGTHFVFGSKSKFEPDGEEGEISIYDRNLSTNETHVVSKTPGGETMAEEGSEIVELDISADGSHILIGKLTGEAEGAKLYHLYMNVGDSSQTIDLTSGAVEGVRFDGMTADGTKVFFSSKEHLTHEDEQHTGDDIFMWDQGQPLTLVSNGTEGDAGSCDPVANTLHAHWNTTGAQNCGDLAIGGGGGVASGDGTIVFLSPSLLDGTQEPTDGVKNAPNLYVTRPGQAPHFVATLESSLTGPLLSRHPLLRSFGSFTTPEFLATDATTGTVYVVDSSTNLIYKLSATGELDSSWREGGKLALGGSPQYEPINGIAIDPTNGNLYVTLNRGNGETKVFTPNGSLIRTFTVGGYTHGLSVDSAGDLYVYESYYHFISKFSSTGTQIGTVLSEIPASGFAVDPAGNELYVDNGGAAVERYSINGAGEAVNPKIVASELSGSGGIALDSAHNVYIDEGSQVLGFNLLGEELSVPFGAGLLHGSSAVAVSSAGDLYAGNPSHSNLAEFGPSEPSPNPRTDSPAVNDAASEPEIRRSADFQLTPSGRFAAFTSTLPLTGAESGGFPQIFRYDATGEKLECVSCNPSGAEATGRSSLATDGSSLTEAGQVFFNSEEPLALRDSDNLTDVYEWEPAGTGICSSESATYGKGSGDCLGLISTGSSPFTSSLLGVSLNGADAYFFTRDSLAPQDENGEVAKLYDARVDGGFFVIPEPPLCRSSDECHGAGSASPPPPNFHRNPGTGGNEVGAKHKKCVPGSVKKHGKCVKKPRHHRRAKHNRRTHSKRGGKK